MTSSESSSDNEMEILQEYYQDPEPEKTISSMLGKVFDEPMEPIAKKIKLDEETFQLVETEGMTAWEPTKEEIKKHPELEYTSEEIKAVISRMSKKQQIQFKEPKTSAEGPRRIIPTQIKNEKDIKPWQMLATQYLPDMMLKAMEGEGDESLQILRVFCGQNPLYDLTKDDDQLKEAFGLIQEDLFPTEHEEADADDLSVVTVDTYDEIDIKEARELLVKLANVKTKEAQILSDLAVVVNAEDLPLHQVGEITKSVLEHE